MKTPRAFALLTFSLFTILPVGSSLPARPEVDPPRWRDRWLYVSSNLYVNENLPELETLLRRADAAGYNGVLFTDYKTATWWRLEAADRWKANAQRLRRLTRGLGMKLVVCVFPFGYAGGLLFHDVNLASGMPIRNAPLIARGGELVPRRTASIENGSFERHRGHRALGYGFQDDPGRSSFIDTVVFRHGRASLRFENVGEINSHGNGRIQQVVQVRPWTQYRLRGWMKARALTADEMRVMVLADGRTLQWQHLKVPRGKRREYVGSPRDLTCDWTEQSVTFNSLDNESVGVYLGLWGGKTGTIWWDDLRIDDVPTLNLLRRDSLPVTLTGPGDTTYTEGGDFERIVDPLLGAKPWAGSYDTRHEPPRVRLTPESRISDGTEVALSGYHATIVLAGQVNCSLSAPEVFELCRQQVLRAVEALDPDGFFMSHDEIRCAGWEPSQTKSFESSGELLAWNIRRCHEIASRAGKGKPVYVWSDMFDPAHNARGDYYLANNTFEGSWRGLDESVIVMKWGGGNLARPGLEFFSGRGHRQMIAAYYDGDVADDHAMWNRAAERISGLTGVMYTTWRHDYSDLERFAELWWGGRD